MTVNDKNVANELYSCFVRCLLRSGRRPGIEQLKWVIFHLIAASFIRCLEMCGQVAVCNIKYNKLIYTPCPKKRGKQASKARVF